MCINICVVTYMRNICIYAYIAIYILQIYMQKMKFEAKSKPDSLRNRFFTEKLLSNITTCSCTCAVAVSKP